MLSKRIFGRITIDCVTPVPMKKTQESKFKDCVKCKSLTLIEVWGDYVWY